MGGRKGSAPTASGSTVESSAYTAVFACHDAPTSAFATIGARACGSTSAIQSASHGSSRASPSELTIRNPSTAPNKPKAPTSACGGALVIKPWPITTFVASGRSAHAKAASFTLRTARQRQPSNHRMMMACVVELPRHENHAFCGRSALHVSSSREKKCSFPKYNAAAAVCSTAVRKVSASPERASAIAFANTSCALFSCL
mmetsp:Transcript_11283/g.37114  ORF Transcript_11283/g.37114 Transcript_11283/m.37114 type:complete len:201 (+) Transcript_11283:2973-3575(+)